MNIKTVVSTRIQDIAHHSAYTYGLEKQMLPPKSPEREQDIVLPGKGHMQTIYNYTNVNSWIGDVPVTFTMLVAQRSYEYTKQIFHNPMKRQDNTTTNSWLI